MNGFSDLFDTTVYKATEQLVCCVGCCKLPADKRMLVPEDPHAPLSAFIVQHLTGSEEQFVFSSPPLPRLGYRYIVTTNNYNDINSRINSRRLKQFNDQFKDQFKEVEHVYIK
jgi:hypothetical protein